MRGSDSLVLEGLCRMSDESDVHFGEFDCVCYCQVRLFAFLQFSWDLINIYCMLVCVDSTNLI